MGKGLHCETVQSLERPRPIKWSLVPESLIPLIASDLVEFTDEEGYGRYLDLHDCYLKYINLKASEVRPRIEKVALILTVSQDTEPCLPCVLELLGKY